MKSRGAWFCTAAQAVAWFRKRRAAKFAFDTSGTSTVRTTGNAEYTQNLPALRLRIYKKGSPNGDCGQHSLNYADAIVDEGREATVLSSTKP
jgi:hypothetical protein